MTNRIDDITRNTALLVMDYQNLILENYLSEETADRVLEKTASLVSSARTRGIPVIYVTVAFRPGFPEVSDRNATFSDIRDHNVLVIGSAGAAIHDRVAPVGNEPVIIKHRYGAFCATDLDLVLKSKGITTLVLAGLTTGGVVLSTVRQAYDLDYTLLVAGDCCADRDDEIHYALINKILPHQSVVTDSDNIRAMWVA